MFLFFCDGVVATVNKGRQIDVIHLDSSKAFGMVPFDILISRLKMHGLERWTIQGIKELAVWIHSKSCSQWCDVQVETSDEWCPSGLSLGTVLFGVFFNNIDSKI